MPIFVAIPESERAALRAGSGAPERFVREMGEPGADTAPIVLWPHELDFGAGLDKGSEECDWKTRPVDLGWFFGLGRAEDGRQREENERRVLPLLSDPLVCVVFLDELHKPDGYAKFRTFGDVAGWAARLQKALSVRFARESLIGRAPRSLVLVTRCQQVSTTKEEIDAFHACIGMDRGRIPEAGSVPVRAFTSCYFLDYNLRLGATGRPFFARDVWEIVVGRLLLAFALSKKGDEEGGLPGGPFYKRPGVKGWRNADCRVGLAREDEAEGMEEALGALTQELRNRLELPENENSLAVSAPKSEQLRKDLDRELKVVLPDGQDNEEWRCPPAFPKGWSDFDAPACLKTTRDEDGKRWGAVLAGWKKAFPGWRRKHRDTGIAWELKGIYDGVAKSPSNVAFQEERLRERLDEGMSVADPVAHWKNMAAEERRRMELLEQLAADTKEFERARSHYVGIGIGAFIFLAATAALGWAGYQVVVSASVLFGGGSVQALPWALAASGCVAAGALGAFVLVLVCHCRTGSRAMKSLIATSKAADQALAERDGEARAIVTEGMVAGMAARIRAGRFRAWMLLKRLQTILDTELSPQLARGRPAEADSPPGGADGRGSSDDVVDRETIQRNFLKATRTDFGPFHLENHRETSGTIGKRVTEWWRDVFMPEWRILAKEDVRNAGNYPARRVVPALRRIMSGFLEEVRSALRSRAGEANRERLVADFGAWMRKQSDGRSLYAYASVGLTGAQVKERPTDAAVVFCSPAFADRVAHGTDLPDKQPVLRHIHGNIMQRESSALAESEWLGLLHHEFRIGLDVDKDGHLCLKGENHVG